MTPYGFSTHTTMSYDAAVETVTAALKSEGFGVLTTIDVKKTLKEKINVEFPRYVILGACNPPFAHQALQADIDIGLLLPCNVVVREVTREGETFVVVSAFDPMMMTKISDNAALEAVAKEVQERLKRVIASVPVK